MTNVYKEAVDAEVQNRNVVVGVAAAKLNPFGFSFMKGILLRTPGTSDPTPNTAPIWLGNAKVTANMEIETGGFPLVPGSSIFIPAEFLKELYAISTQADQNLAWLGV
jgi:hypothetical protein